VAGRIRSIEESGDLIGNRTHDLLACSIVPRPTALPHAPIQYVPENISPGVRRPVRKANHSPPPSAEVKISETIHGKDALNFTSYVFLWRRTNITNG
jgi:hypothetical protein